MKFLLSPVILLPCASALPISTPDTQVSDRTNENLNTPQGYPESGISPFSDSNSQVQDFQPLRDICPVCRKCPSNRWCMYRPVPRPLWNPPSGVPNGVASTTEYPQHPSIEEVAQRPHRPTFHTNPMEGGEPAALTGPQLQDSEEAIPRPHRPKCHTNPMEGGEPAAPTGPQRQESEGVDVPHVEVGSLGITGMAQ
ncbi:hypothetical protein BCR34DRAFT_590531 [Clohesyomyces aquaticus]|uniref:Uncharacterized protein n=1 Tax=Clohesyomyces aquaticus TaxID=1231657 RepID=A0A1Y1Z9D9_9PLEO|nr:hypothetical protein BCR34DRAFT_590531 [Clohesyomyces aquaticus]